MLGLGVCDEVRFKPTCSAREADKSLETGYNMYKYYRILVANNKGIDQTVQMRRLIYALVFAYGTRHIFSYLAHMMLDK